MKTTKIFLLLTILALFLAAGYIGISLYENFTLSQRSEKSVLSILKSEELSFLVTDKLTSQICVEISENSPLLGKREGILIGTVTMYYGIDLAAITPESIQENEKIITITLPPVKELDFSLDPSSMKYITKRSGLNVIADYFMNRNIEQELRSQMKSSAEKFFADRKMIPSRNKIISRLNLFFQPIADNAGITIKFE